MNQKSIRFIRKLLNPYPNKKLLDELISIYGEDDVLQGNINLYEKTKQWWKTKTIKEKNEWKRQLT